MTVYDTLESMQRAVAEFNARETEAERIEGLCTIAYKPDIKEMAQMDPFSMGYRDRVIEIYRAVSGRRDYCPAEHELSPYLSEIADERPGCYLAGSTAYLGDLLMAMGSVLKHLGLKPNQSLLEYGAGEGGIALEAAKAGANVTVVDIEPKYLGLIERRAKAAKVEVKTIVGLFGCDVGAPFDCVLFYESFHHALDHFEVAKKIRAMLKPGGKLILAGEPVIGPHNEHWRPALPYKWGLRLDGLSFRAIQTYGWMELGYDHDYLIEMLTCAGYSVEFHRCLSTDRGSAYIATPLT